MKTDLYTKIVLSVIAVCLTVLTLQQVNVIPPVFAQSGQDRAIPVNYDGSINVKIVGVSNNLPVVLKDYPYSGIPVEVKSVYPRTIPVKVENSYIYVKQY